MSTFNINSGPYTIPTVNVNAKNAFNMRARVSNGIQFSENYLSKNPQYTQPRTLDTDKKSTMSLGGLGFGTIRELGNNIMSGVLNSELYSNLNTLPYGQTVKDVLDPSQDPIARAVKNLTGKGRDNVLKSIHNDTPNDDLFKFSIVGNDNSTLLNNFGYDSHTDEELGIRQNIRRKNFWQAFGDFNNQAGVGALYGAEVGGGWGALAGLAIGAIAGGINWANDDKNVSSFNSAINQENLLKRAREKAYQEDYLAQYATQVDDVADMNYRDNIRDYYGILRDGGSIYIKPSHRGRFTELKERTGHSATWFKENGTPAQKKMATFALNAAKWHHKADGGDIIDTPSDDGNPTVLPVNSQGLPYYTLPDVVVSDTALPYARFKDNNNNLYRYYNAVQTGQIGLNQIKDKELRNRVRGYKGEEYVRNGRKTAAKIATATAALPIGMSLLPEALGLLSNPVVNTALTVDGIVNAPKNIKEGIDAIREGDYTEGGIDLGLSALDIAGAGMLHKSLAPFRKRLAETILRQGDKIRTLDFYPGIKDKAKYLFLGNKYPEAAYKTGYYSGEKMLPKENMSHKGDVIDGFLGKEYNVQGEDLSKASKKAQEYIQKNYRRKAKDVKVYDLGTINNEFRGKLMSEADANAYLNRVRKFRNEDSGIRKGEKFVLDPQGYNITNARREGNNLIIDKEDIWKYNPKDYTKRYENTSLLERLGLRFLDSQGTPMVHKWTEVVPIEAKHSFATGGQIPPHDDWKALRNIRYNVYPDTTFTRDKTGYGSIEVFDKNNGDTIRYPNGYTIVNPYPNQNTIYYNPDLNDEQDIKLDALHLMPQDATYDALYTEYMNAINSGDVYFNAKNRYNDDVKRYGKNNIDSFDQYLRNEADGLLRNMFIEGTPEYMKSKNYYPDKEQLAQWNENLMPYINNIHNYLVTGERPKNVLPEVVIKPTDYRNGGELGTMDDINNGFIDITEGGTHEQNPLGGVPVNIAEDGLPNLVEEGEMIYNGYVYSNNLRPSEETKKRLGLKGSTYADVIRKAQKYSSERPNDPVAKEYDKYIATTLAVEQEQQKMNQDMKKTNKKGIRGHYAKLGDWLGKNAYKGMYAPVVANVGQWASDLVGNTNQYDYSEIDDFRRNAGDLQTPVLVGYNDVGQKLRYNPMDSDYMMNRTANQAAATRSMLRYASPTTAALQRNLMGLNYTGITSLADALMNTKQYNDKLRSDVVGFNNALDLQNAGNRFNAAQANAQAINRYREALADRNFKLAATQAEMRSNIDAAISNARDTNRTAAWNSIGDAGKQFAIFNMIKNDPYLLYAWTNNFDVDYTGKKKDRNGGWLRCGGSIRNKRRK